jgi:hypothetical protein
MFGWDFVNVYWIICCAALQVYLRALLSLSRSSRVGGFGAGAGGVRAATS